MKTIYQKELLYPEILWERPVHYYKSKAGRVLIIAGSSGNQAPALMASDAVFKCGTGVLTLAFPEGLKETYSHILPDAMTLALPQTHPGSIARSAKELILEQAKSSDLLIIGPGLSTNTETVQLIWEILPETKKTIVLSDDGVQALIYGLDAIRSKEGIEKVKQYFKDLESKLIIIADLGDITKVLSALGIKDKKHRESYIKIHIGEIVNLIYQHIGAMLIIKGENTVIYNGKKIVIDKTSADSNEDILAGVIGSFVAQNPTRTFKAIVTAVYLHSLTVKMASEDLGPRTITANALLKHLPKAIKASEQD